MKKIYFSFLIAALLTNFSSAQQAQWLTSVPINYSFNPETPQQPACVSGNKIFAGRMVDFNLSFGVDIFGSMSIDCHDTSGVQLWSFPLGQKANIHCISADASGNVYVGGVFMETLHLTPNDSLENTGSNFDTNLFLLSLDASGNLRWKRNLSLTHADAFNISCLDIDPQSNCWYALEFFDSCTIKRLDATGQDVQSHIIMGTRTLGSFSFDPNGNMFLAGSAGFLTLSVNGYSVNAPEPYMMFVSRINAAGNASWIQLVHDVTFQSPQIVATASGDAYVAGNLMDTAVFGNVSFHHPQWVYDIFLTKVDASGNFSWGVQVPETPIITGDFMRGRNNFVDVDAAGNVYLAGIIRGIVDWGNGVITDAGAITNYGGSVISFDNNGVARWQVTGSAAGFIAPYSLCVTGQDECYFSAGISGSVTFNSISANQGGGFAFLLGKISGSTSSGIDELSSGELLNVYPNPANNKLAIGSRQYAIKAIQIYNFIGELVLSVQLQASNFKPETTIDVSHLPAGSYFLQAGNARAMFVVQHY